MTRLQLGVSPSRSISPKGISRIYRFRERWYRVPKCVVGIGGGGPIAACWSLGLCILLGTHYCIQVVDSECISRLDGQHFTLQGITPRLESWLHLEWTISVLYYILHRNRYGVNIWSSPSKAHALETWLPADGLWKVSESWVSELININPLMNLYHCGVTGK